MPGVVGGLDKKFFRLVLEGDRLVLAWLTVIPSVV